MKFEISLVLICVFVFPGWTEGLARDVVSAVSQSPPGPVPGIYKFGALITGCGPLKASNVQLNCTMTVKKVPYLVDCNKRAPKGTKATFKCMPGFVTSEKQKVATCVSPRKWSKPLITCKEAPSTTTQTTVSTTESTTEVSTESTTDDTTIQTVDPWATDPNNPINIATAVVGGAPTVAGSNTTVAGATTTVAGATNTVAGATTTVAGATTTVAGATTTVAGAITTVAGGTTIDAGATTTVAGATTTVAGATTTVAGATTTVAGATTTVAGATTTVAGATTTVAGATTTVAGATTTVAGATTTVAGATTTVAGATTTVAGATTTVAGATTVATTIAATTTSAATTVAGTTAAATTLTDTTVAATTTVATTTTVVCPVGYDLLSGVCYKAVKTVTTWANAEANCVLDGAHHFTIDTSAEFTTLLAFMSKYNMASDIHYGINDMTTEGAFKTPLGNALVFVTGLKWYTGHPNDPAGSKDCTTFWSDKTLENVACTLTRQYICEK